jgi:hypothetical protein
MAESASDARDVINQHDLDSEEESQHAVTPLHTTITTTL